MKRVLSAALLAACLGVSACVATEQVSSTACEVGTGDILMKSTTCDGEQMQCNMRTDAFQRIWILNRSSNAAAVTIQFSDGTSERRVMPAGGDYTAEKPIGTGVKVLSQC